MKINSEINFREDIEKYFELKYKYRINDYKRVADFENKTIEEIKNSYLNKGGIDEYYCIKLNFSKDYLNKINFFFNEFEQFYKNYYNKERKVIFQSFEIFDWFNKHKNKCGYCGITQLELYKIKNLRGGNFTLNKKEKRKNATLEIEQKDCTLKDYSYLENLIFACPLCNNAKSNLISEEDWQYFFVNKIKEYYNKILE